MRVPLHGFFCEVLAHFGVNTTNSSSSLVHPHLSLMTPSSRAASRMRMAASVMATVAAMIAITTVKVVQEQHRDERLPGARLLER
jgi:hypothetical protein